jgi:hypothetical protein
MFFEDAIAETLYGKRSEPPLPAIYYSWKNALKNQHFMPNTTTRVKLGEIIETSYQGALQKTQKL